MPVDRTHDISNASYHVKDVEALGKVLTEAGNAAFPNRGRSRYKEAHVLLLSWEDDDLGVIDEVNDLQDVFRQSYNYKTDMWKIPGTRSHNSLATRILQFLADYEAKDSLLIVYYGGHGLMNDDRQCIWSWSVCFPLLNLSYIKWCYMVSLSDYFESAFYTVYTLFQDSEELSDRLILKVECHTHRKDATTPFGESDR